ncbi:MAG: S1C family serine protease, partial [Blastocatellia bacterium]
MYRVSAKQLILLALLTAGITVGLVSLSQKALQRVESDVQPTVIADPSVATDEQNNIQIYKAVSPGVVNITASGLHQGFWGMYPSSDTGSGSIIDKEGHILTNYHVVQSANQQLEVQIEKNQYPAKIIGTDRDNDLAVIKVDLPPSRLTVVRLGSSTGLEVGQKVLAIGNPFGLQRTMTTGIISGLDRPLYDSVAQRTIEGAIQTDASINPGNSGGPLLNDRGEMIGINTAIYSANGQGGGSIGIGFAVPVDLAKKIVPDLIAKGYVPRPWLGASLLPLNASYARAFRIPTDQGVIVGNVYQGTGAAEAGLKPCVISETIWGGQTLEQLGDVIISI